MRRYACIFAVILVSAALHAESVWTGNAAVGGIAEFPGNSSTYRAASNSFPPGTVLKVTNPRGGRSVEVTVIGRLESPGVFILIEEQAAENMGLPLDHVMPVRVTPLNSDTAVDAAESMNHDSAISGDSDYNPATSISEEDEELRVAAVPITDDSADIPDSGNVPVEETVMPETSSETISDSDNSGTKPEVVIEGDEVASVGADDEDISSDADSGITETDSLVAAGDTVIAEKTPAVPPETIITYDLSDNEVAPADTSTVIADSADSAEPDPERSVFFLMPSDMKPPEPVADKSPVTDGASVSETPTATAVNPVPTLTPEAISDSGMMLHQVETGDNQNYIQIGAYRSHAVLEDSARRISSLAPGYPLSIVEESSSAGSVWKLLIGPLKPAEIGIILQTARSTLFPDTFPYSP